VNTVLRGLAVRSVFGAPLRRVMTTVWRDRAMAVSLRAAVDTVPREDPTRVPWALAQQWTLLCGSNSPRCVWSNPAQSDDHRLAGSRDGGGIEHSGAHRLAARVSGCGNYAER
jgi:hypothetical protein